MNDNCAPSALGDCARAAPGDHAPRAGTVTAAGAGELRIRLDPGEDEAAAGCRTCAARLLCRGGREDGITLSLPARPGLAPGDRVRVRYRAPNPAAAAAALFIPALAGLAAGAGAAWWLAPGRDGVFLAGCAVGLATGVAATFLVNRRARAAGGAEVLEKLPGEIHDIGK